MFQLIKMIYERNPRTKTPASHLSTEFIDKVGVWFVVWFIS